MSKKYGLVVQSITPGEDEVVVSISVTSSQFPFISICLLQVAVLVEEDKSLGCYEKDALEKAVHLINDIAGDIKEAA
ncbi:hypothetical protein OGY72_07590 [Citrobacter sp. Cpo221]|uniref:DUF1327 domain-containing protein n=1 Tax=Citrobacter sp. Cpo221 TaxID=2985155 RepID=UPI002578A486|nr:DUF1327 domain-containing protein [Citrobacter sp. Cpo221]MDM2753720.1 hypothetical protein [Citrobacter sp. Cpo221]